MAQLSAREIAQYQCRRLGDPAVPAARGARVATMREALDELIRNNPGVRPEKLVSAHVEGDNGEGVRGSRQFLDLAMDPEIVELVSGVIGDDVILWGCHVFCKPAAEGYETPGTRTATTGRSGRWPTARSGWRWKRRRSRTAACASSPARTAARCCTSTCMKIAPT